MWYLEGHKTEKEISRVYCVSERTLRRWISAYNYRGVTGLKPLSTTPKTCRISVSPRLVQRIIRLKAKNPAWGARRIKYQFNLPVSWRTVHRILKKNGLLFKIKAKPQPCRRFQRYKVDSLWQGDSFQFRIKEVGKVYVTGFEDDCSRFRVRSKAYLHIGATEAVNCLRWALRSGRKPRQVYLDNGKQFIAKEFKKEAKKNNIKLVFGKPGRPQGRGKIESYHRIPHRELVSQKTFTSLSHFRRELWKFDLKYNHWRKHAELGWQTPASVYHDEKYFKKDVLKGKQRTNVLSTKADKS